MESSPLLSFYIRSNPYTKTWKPHIFPTKLGQLLAVGRPLPWPVVRSLPKTAGPSALFEAVGPQPPMVIELLNSTYASGCFQREKWVKFWWKKLELKTARWKSLENGEKTLNWWENPRSICVTNNSPAPTTTWAQSPVSLRGRFQASVQPGPAAHRGTSLSLALPGAVALPRGRLCQPNRCLETKNPWVGRFLSKKTLEFWYGKI